VFGLVTSLCIRRGLFLFFFVVTVISGRLPLW
jgi:hypothetical protein